MLRIRVGPAEADDDGCAAVGVSVSVRPLADARAVYLCVERSTGAD